MSGRMDIPIAPETRARVLQAARELGYTPNAAASALRTGKTGMLGFWMTLQYSRYRSQVVDQMRKALGPTGLAMAVTDADADYWEHGAFSRALRLPVDGIIAFDASASVEAFARDADRLAPNIPFVSMGAYWSELRSYVGVDLRAGAEVAVEHLLQRGRRRIAYMAPEPSGLLTSGDRHDGYVAKMREAGLEPVVIGSSEVSPDAIEYSLSPYLQGEPKIDAIVCVTDEYALDTLIALERLGRSPGEDVMLIGFNGTEGIDRGPCPLSTMAQPIEEMCRLALEFLLAQMDDPHDLRRQILKPILIPRKSTGGD